MSPNPDYPARVEIEYPDRLSRLLIFVKWLLAIPHFIALIVLGFVAYVVLIFAWFAVLFTGRYPRGMFEFLTGVLRWGTRVGAYVFLQTDRYPPFSLEDDPSYPVRVTVDYPERIARWRPLVHWLLAIPVLLVAYGLAILAEFLVFIAWFVILITGRFPAGMFNLVNVYWRWHIRTLVFSFWMTERYPPFVMA